MATSGAEHKSGRSKCAASQPRSKTKTKNNNIKNTHEASQHTQVDASPFRVWRRAVRAHLIRIDRKDGRDLLQLFLLSLFPLFGFYLSSQSFLGSQAGRIFCVLLSARFVCFELVRATARVCMFVGGYIVRVSCWGRTRISWAVCETITHLPLDTATNGTSPLVEVLQPCRLNAMQWWREKGGYLLGRVRLRWVSHPPVPRFRASPITAATKQPTTKTSPLFASHV